MIHYKQDKNILLISIHCRLRKLNNYRCMLECVWQGLGTFKMGIRLGIKGKVRRNRLLFRMILIEERSEERK